MAITYLWEFPCLRVKLDEGGLQNVVYLIDWTYTANDGNGTQCYLYGQVSVAAPDPEQFTPYEELTKTQVQGWVETAIGEEQIYSMQNSLSLQIESITNPTDAVRQPPWISNSGGDAK